MTLLRVLARPILLLAGLLAAGLTLRELPVQDFGAWAATQGPVVFVLAGAALCALGVPRQAIAFAGGYGFGLWAGAGLGMLAQALGCLADLVWARAVARRWARRHAGRLARVDRLLAAHPFSTTLTLRLLPVGNNLALNLLAGVSAVAVGPFLAASVLGYLPQTVIFALLGGGVRVAQGVQIGVGVALFAGSAAIGVWLWRREQGQGSALAPRVDAVGGPAAPDPLS